MKRFHFLKSIQSMSSSSWFIMHMTPRRNDWNTNKQMLSGLWSWSALLGTGSTHFGLKLVAWVHSRRAWTGQTGQRGNNWNCVCKEGEAWSHQTPFAGPAVPRGNALPPTAVAARSPLLVELSYLIGSGSAVAMCICYLFVPISRCEIVQPTPQCWQHHMLTDATISGSFE